MKKILIVLLMVSLTVSSVFANGSEEKKNSSDDKIVIGCNNFLKGIYSLDILEKNFVTTCNALGVEPMVVNDEGKIENCITNVDNMIASGVDGILILGLSDTVFPVIAQKCESAGVYFAFYDHMPSEASMQRFRNYKYFAGVAATSDLDTGRNMGNYAAESGLKKAFILTGLTTDTTHLNRTNGFTSAFEAAGGKVVAQGYGNVSRADALQMSDDLLTAYPDVDCIYGSNGDYAAATLESMAKHPKVNAKLYATDLDPDILTGLKDGKISAANGAHWVNIDYTTALLVNAIKGHKILGPDNNAAILTVPVMVLPNKYIELYNSNWIEASPYSDSEIQAMVGEDVTRDTLQAMLNDYTIEKRLEAMVADGRITKAQLDNANAQ